MTGGDKVVARCHPQALIFCAEGDVWECTVVTYKQLGRREERAILAAAVEQRGREAREGDRGFLTPFCLTFAIHRGGRFWAVILIKCFLVFSLSCTHTYIQKPRDRDRVPHLPSSRVRPL